MTTGALVTASLLTMLAAAHSTLGETGFVKPLLNAEWTIGELPRPVANRLLRGAWHLTSVAWLAMAVIAVGGTALTAIAVASLVSGIVIIAVSPAHFAWPMFLIAGGAGLRADGALPDLALDIGAWLTVAALVCAAALHVYWAVGGTVLLDAAVPTTEIGNNHTFSPGPLLTVAVAGLLLGYAGLVALVVTDAGPATWDPPVIRWLAMGGVAVLAARAVGDGRYAGFSKKYRDSDFGRMDDQYFTPLIVSLALGATGALL